jgi:uncharacterized protein (TIGR03067 family)
MRTRLSLAVGLIAAAGFAAPAVKDGAPKPPDIAGEWNCEQRLVGGKPDPELARIPVRLVIAGAAWQAHTPDGPPAEAVLELDPKASPPALTLYSNDDPARGRRASLTGIYRLDGDTLTICYVLGDGPRPTVFESAAGSEVRIMTLRKVKK